MISVSIKHWQGTGYWRNILGKLTNNNRWIFIFCRKLLHILFCEIAVIVGVVWGRVCAYRSSASVTMDCCGCRSRRRSASGADNSPGSAESNAAHQQHSAAAVSGYRRTSAVSTMVSQRTTAVSARPTIHNATFRHTSDLRCCHLASRNKALISYGCHHYHT